MKKYLVLTPMTTTEKKLLINGDIIYTKAVEKGISGRCGWQEFEVYHSKTREYLGNLKNEDNLELKEDYGTKKNN